MKNNSNISIALKMDPVSIRATVTTKLTPAQIAAQTAFDKLYKCTKIMNMLKSMYNAYDELSEHSIFTPDDKHKHHIYKRFEELRISFGKSHVYSADFLCPKPLYGGKWKEDCKYYVIVIERAYENDKQFFNYLLNMAS